MPVKIIVSREICGNKLFGGIGTHILHLLRRKDENQIFITSRVSFFQLHSEHKNVIAFASEGFKNFGNRSWLMNIVFLLSYRLRVAFTIFRISRVQVVDVEFAEYMFEGIFVVLMPRRFRRNLRITTRLHGSSAFDRKANTMQANSFRNHFFWMLEKIQIERSDCVVAPTHFAKDLFKSHIRKEIIVRSNAFVSESAQVIDSGTITYTYIGSSDIDKGTETVKKLILYNPDLTFEVLGNLEFKAPNLYTTIIPNHSMAQHLTSKRRILLSPSKSETFGYTFLEGLYYTSLVLASDIPVYRELSLSHAKSNVIFIDPYDHSKWLEAIRENVSA